MAIPSSSGFTWKFRPVANRTFRPIFPVVLYLYVGTEALAPEEYRMELFGREVLHFRYESVRLARLDVEEHRRKDSPVGAALGAMMDRSRSPSPAEPKASLRLRVVKSGLDDARQFLLLNLVETYFELRGEERPP